MDPLNGSANRAVISNSTVIVSETNTTLLSLKSDIATSAHINGIETRVNRLSNVNMSFQSVVNEYHTALKKYLHDVEQTFGRDILLQSPNASEADINAALANAVEYARSSHVDHSTIVMQEVGEASTNSIAKELLPKYPDLLFLADTFDALIQSIAFYNNNVQYTFGGTVGGVAVPLDSCSPQRVGGGLFVLLIIIIIIAVLVSRSNPSTESKSQRSY